MLVHFVRLLVRMHTNRLIMASLARKINTSLFVEVGNNISFYDCCYLSLTVEVTHRCLHCIGWQEDCLCWSKLQGTRIGVEQSHPEGTLAVPQADLFVLLSPIHGTLSYMLVGTITLSSFRYITQGTAIVSPKVSSSRRVFRED